MYLPGDKVRIGMHFSFPGFSAFTCVSLYADVNNLFLLPVEKSCLDGFQNCFSCTLGNSCCKQLWKVLWKCRFPMPHSGDNECFFIHIYGPLSTESCFPFPIVSYWTSLQKSFLKEAELNKIQNLLKLFHEFLPIVLGCLGNKERWLRSKRLPHEV